MRSTTRLSFTALALTSALAIPGTAVAKEPNLSAALPADARIQVREELPNGMQLWIRPHQQPKGRVALLLHIAAGSMQEEEAQRGLAHFIEHMAFNGSTNFAPGTLVPRFEAIGAAFGRDLNAFTSFDQVGYMVNLPKNDAAALELGMTYLADVSRRLTLTQPEIDKERPVIIEELRSRDHADMRLMERALNVVAPGSLAAKRFPGGIREVVEAAKRPAFVRYYQAWYRPELATFVVVGDVEPEPMRALVRKHFEAWKNPIMTTGAAKKPSGLAPLDTLRAAVLTDPDLTTATSGTSQVLAPRPRKTLGDYRARLVERLAAYVGHQRMTRRLRAGNAPYQDASFDVVSFLGGARLATSEVESEPEQWAAAQRALLEETRRLHVHGILDDELERAKASFLASAEARAATDGAQPSSAIVRQWTQALSQGRVPMSPKQAVERVRLLLPTVTVKDVETRFKEMFALDRGALLLTLPPDANVGATDEALRNLVGDVVAAPVTAPTSDAHITRLLAKPPTPGKVALETAVTALGATRWVLDNGVVVVAKPMPEAKSVVARVLLYGGVLNETAKNRGLTMLLGAAMGGGRAATRQHTPQALAQYLSDKQASVALQQGDIFAALGISGPADGIEPGFEMAHVLLTEPRVDAASFVDAKRDVATQLAESVKQTQVAVNLRMAREMTEDPRIHLPSNDAVQGFTQAQAQAWLDRMVGEAPMEVVIAGDLTLDRAKELALRYFGSLPTRPDQWQDVARLRKCAVAFEGPIEVVEPVDTTSAAAVVALAWHGVGKGDPAERARAMQTAMVLQSRVTSEIREKHGLSYSPMAGYTTALWEGLDQFVLSFTAAPEKAKAAAKIAHDLVVKFAEQGPTESEIASAQQRIQAGIAVQERSPQFWASILGGWSMTTDGLAGAAKFLEALTAVDGKAIHEVTKTMVQPKRLLQVIGTPKSHMPAAPEPGAAKNDDAKDDDDN